MTRDPVGRRGVGILDSLRRLDAGTILATILVLGLVLRVFIAAVYMPLSGLSNDVGAFNAWGQRLASIGPAEFYEPGYFADYPPGYLYVLWVLGEVGAALTPIVGVNTTGGLVKVPGILADIGVAWLLFIIVRRWGSELIERASFRISPERAGLAAAAIYLFNPGTIFDSAVWGQIDAVGTLVLLGAIYFLARGWTEAAAVGAVVAMLIKFQFAFLIPIVAVVGIKRHLLGRSSDPDHDGQSNWARVLTSLAAGVATIALLLFPFRMTLWTPAAAGTGAEGCLGFLPAGDPSTSLIGKLCEAANTYVGFSINAFNMWRNPWTGLGDTLHRGDDTGVGLIIGGLSLSWQQLGTLLFIAAALLALWQVARRDDLRGVVMAALVLSIAFFALPTRVHERYLFPALALGALVIFSGRIWPWLYGAISVVFFANVYWLYSEDWSFVTDTVQNPGLGGLAMVQDAFLEGTLLTDAGIWLLGLLITVVLGVVAWLAVRLALSPRNVDELEAEARPAPSPAAVRARRAPPVGGVGGSAWLSPNPADAYFKEPRRRLDRRDALILLGLVAFALVFRLWRLDRPRSPHFDEVYHARSAAEFLSAWQNDWDRDVYEWTHPMLAKYLIAGGIVLADPNKVVGSASLDAPSPALAVAPERASSGFERSIALTTDGGTTIVAADAETGDEVARWTAGGPVATLAYDPDGQRLLVGRADSGTVGTYELAGLLASPDGRAPPAGPPIDSGLETVDEIVVPSEPTDPILLRGTDGLAIVDSGTDEVRGPIAGAFGGVGYVRAVAADDPDWVVGSRPAVGEIAFFDAETLDPRSTEPIGVEATLVGPLVVRGNGDDQQLFALTGPLAATEEFAATSGGIAVADADGSNNRCAGDPCVLGLVPLPGAPVLIGQEPASGLVFVAGTTQAGAHRVWPIEPHMEVRGGGSIGMAAFDATPLAGAPLAMAFDSATTAQSDDHGRLLVSAVDESGAGTVTVIDAGSNAFAWRLAGVVFGAALVGLVYLLAATMFSRRRIAVLAAAFVALDPMSYVMSRISMNDIFVATFIVAAYLVFWQIWSGRWARSAWWAMPLVGVLIGLAAASKWVGFYALAGLLVLVLARSDLGRLLLVALVAVVLVIGGVGGPWPFLVVMLALLALALAISWVRPIRLDVGESISAIAATTMVVTGVGLAFAFAYGSVEGREPGGAVEYLFGLLARGAQAAWPVWIMIGVAVALIAWRAYRSLRDPVSDARWFRPGEMGGFAWSWAGACLVIVPLVVYGLSYVPYLQLGHDWAIGGGPGYGWSVDELHAQMFGYHFNLTAGHDSASPWWSWPLALKPTWFHVSNFDGRQVALIYNGGNPILFWAGIPALVACGILAWKRRSLALALILAAFAFQFVPWIRIERATFAYHYLTALIFAMIAVAYVVDELLRRPAWREPAIGYLALAAVVGILIFPLGSAFPMPDWYANAARALPPWNFSFTFPDPPTGNRNELLNFSGLKLIGGLLLAGIAAAFAVAGRALLDGLYREPRDRGGEPMMEGG
jgi:predicted membrane-bound dolichyl-phosphate-mannose-protein mannosyltransferase